MKSIDFASEIVSRTLNATRLSSGGDADGRCDNRARVLADDTKLFSELQAELASRNALTSSSIHQVIQGFLAHRFHEKTHEVQQRILKKHSSRRTLTTCDEDNENNNDTLPTTFSRQENNAVLFQMMRLEAECVESENKELPRRPQLRRANTESQLDVVSNETDDRFDRQAALQQTSKHGGGGGGVRRPLYAKSVSTRFLPSNSLGSELTTSTSSPKRASPRRSRSPKLDRPPRFVPNPLESELTASPKRASPTRSRQSSPKASKQSLSQSFTSHLETAKSLLETEVVE
mmetsp:Transcript_18237/g.42231  ORF Transcript_18237/g.42231 Transcript_18237/m.42231 type:complete len:289 (-) Transcript_18237:941-1807(-)